MICDQHGECCPCCDHGYEEDPCYCFDLWEKEEQRFVYLDGEMFEFIDGELWETEIKPRPENE